ncbi:MAG: hypothetical protein KGJ79_16115 [Alphaproteobacteria bacterium]|nr:hypothetical protein [Alphaproteobacteria bacterium]MDE2496069.1 hypothetical protein [Alphaproteobacteria bacterium]
MKTHTSVATRYDQLAETFLGMWFLASARDGLKFVRRLNLAPAPYSGSDLNARLDDAARTFVNHPRGVSLQRGQFTVSTVYQWYAADFGDTDNTVIAHLRKYAAPAPAMQLAHRTRIEPY